MRLSSRLLSKLVHGFFVCGLIAVWAIEAAAGEPAGPVFNPLGGKAPTAGSERAYALLLKGSEAEAYDAFKKAAAESPDDATALFGLGHHERLRGNEQGALEQYAKALSIGRKHPWAEIFLDSAESVLPSCRDPKPLLETLAALEADNAIRPLLKDRSRRAHAEWLVKRGEYAEASKVFDALQYVKQWALIGPFDNRDGAGLDTTYEPETEIRFDMPSQGRNRKVSWFHCSIAPMTGIVDLSQTFASNTHSLAYALSHVKLETAQWVVLRVGCAGAVKVWVNEREVGKVPTYNDFASEKLSVPVYLQKGWNRVLVKTGIGEAGGWSFSLRFSKTRGGPVPGLVVGNDATAMQGYQKASVGRRTPLLEPRAPDLGILNRLRKALKRSPKDPLLRAWYGFEIEKHRLGNREDRLASREYEKAIEQCPKCPLFRMMLFLSTGDVNRTRISAEACMKSHPHLAAPHAFLAGHAFDSGLGLTAEQFARSALKKYGFEKAGRAALYLGYVLRDRGYQAEAHRLADDLVKRAPYDGRHWELLLGLDSSNSARRATIKKALGFCGGNRALRQSWANELRSMAREKEAAAFLAKGLAAQPFSIQDRIRTARAWRRAGDEVSARKVLQEARGVAPENPNLLAALADEALREKKLDEAVKLWREVLRVKPNSPSIKDMLAETARGRGLDREFFAPYDVQLKDLPRPQRTDYPNDNAVTMWKQEVVHVNPNGTSSRMVHEVSMLLRPGGRRSIQNKQIYYDPSRQVVDILRASVITPGGRELARAQVSDRTISAAMGLQTRVYDEYYLKQITFQDLEVGSIVDLQYVLRDTGDNVYGDYFADMYYVGDEIPVVKSQYILNLPKSRTFQTREYRATIQPKRLNSKDPAREIFKWEAEDLPGIAKEARMPPAIDLVPFVQATTMKTWHEVGTWYWNLSKEQIQITDDMKRTVAEITRDADSATEKLRAIHDWVIRKIRYLSISFGRSGYKPHRSTETFRSLYGDCKDTAVLITAMLKCVGIDSRIVLVRTRDAGKVEAECLPAPNVFNHCIAYVPDADGRDYWIDCTTDYHQLGEVPYSDQGAQVLVVGPDGGEFVQIPEASPGENRVEQRIEATLNKDGSGKIFVRDVRRGQEAPWYRRMAATPGKFKRFLEALGARRYPGAKMTRHNTAAPEDQGGMWMEAQYQVPSLASQSGDRMTLSSVIEPLRLSRRYLTTGKRKHDLELWYPRSRVIEIDYHLDPSFAIVALPEAIELEEDFGSFKRTVSKDGNMIRIRDTFAITSQRIPKDQYQAFHTFCQKVDAILEQKILLKK